MKMKLLLSGVLFLFITSVFAQTNLNEYKYVIVPNKFDFLKEKDQYRLNSLAKFLFEKYGFNALMEGEEYPEDLRMNRCLALRSDVLKESGMFKTKLKVELKDCNDQVVYISPTGESREKEFQKAYNLATRAAFEHLEYLSYSYEPSKNITAIRTVSNAPQSDAKSEVSKEIQELKEEIENLKKQKVETKHQDEVVKAEPKQEFIPETVPEKEVEKPVVPETKDIKFVKTKEKARSVIVNEDSQNILYAQANSKGFQVVDNTPKIVMVLLTTVLDDVFIVKDKNAIVFKKDGVWFYSDNATASGVLNLKF